MNRQLKYSSLMIGTHLRASDIIRQAQTGNVHRMLCYHLQVLMAGNALKTIGWDGSFVGLVAYALRRPSNHSMVSTTRERIRRAAYRWARERRISIPRHPGKRIPRKGTSIHLVASIVINGHRTMRAFAPDDPLHRKALNEILEQIEGGDQDPINPET